jgi:hypothetical protein
MNPASAPKDGWRTRPISGILVLEHAGEVSPCAAL